MSTKKALVVDDDPVAQEEIGRELRAFGADVDTASNLQEASRHLEEKRYDLVISGNSMPDLDQGVELLAYVRKESGLNKKTRFILNTDKDSRALQQRVKELGGWYRSKNSVNVSVLNLVVVGLE